MRRIERMTQFNRDYKREIKGRHRKSLENDFVRILNNLVYGDALPDKHRDHALTGEWND